MTNSGSPKDQMGAELPKLPPYSQSAFPHGFHELWTEKQMKQYARETATFWRNDVVEKAAEIVERYGADPWIARDIRAIATTEGSKPGEHQAVLDAIQSHNSGEEE